VDKRDRLKVKIAGNLEYEIRGRTYQRPMSLVLVRIRDELIKKY
jgi:hypothetical protein